MEILFTANGPGELSAWTLPLARKLKEVASTPLTISLFLLPCQFSNGFEHLLAEESGLFQNISHPKDYQKFLFTRKLPEGYQPQAQGLVFYTGGDSWHAINLAKYLGWPLAGYDEGHLQNKRLFTKVFTLDLDGNLMIDSALEKKYYFNNAPIGADKVSLAMFPGSRVPFLKFMIPFYNKVAALICEQYPNVQPCFVLSSDMSAYIAANKKYQLNYPLKRNTEEFPIDLALTLVGTNTAILAARGIPMLVLLPLNHLSDIPLTGLLGLLGNIPLLGLAVQWVALKFSKVHKKIHALPNKKQNKYIVPEMVGKLQPQQVANRALKILANINARNLMHEELAMSIGMPGAAQKIALSLKRSYKL